MHINLTKTFHSGIRGPNEEEDDNLAFLKKSLYMSRAKLFCTSCENSRRLIWDCKICNYRTLVITTSLVQSIIIKVSKYLVVRRMEHNIVSIIDGELLAFKLLIPTDSELSLRNPQDQWTVAYTITEHRSSRVWLSGHTCCKSVYSKNPLPSDNRFVTTSRRQPVTE